MAEAFDINDTRCNDLSKSDIRVAEEASNLIYQSESGLFYIPLDKRDVCIIANELSSVAHNWQLIGTCLGVDQSEIKEIEEQRLLPKKALVELITKWLSTNRRVTWNDILTALRMPLLKEECLANEIEKKVLSRTLRKSISSPPHTEENSSCKDYLRSGSSPASVQSSASILLSSSSSQQPDLPFNGTSSSSIPIPEVGSLMPVQMESSNQLMSTATQATSLTIYESHEHHPSKGPLSAEVDQDKLPYSCGCGECPVSEFFAGNCPNPLPTVSKFPYLDTRGLSEEDREELEFQLNDDFLRINEEYASLTASLRISLRERKVTPRDLFDSLMDLRGFQPIKSSTGEKSIGLLQNRYNEIKDAESITEVFEILSTDYCSFFNYDIVAFIIKKLGTDDDKKMLVAYESSLENYCKHHIFECPCYSQAGKRSKFPNLVLKLDASNIAEFTLKALKQFSRKFARVLGVSKNALNVRGIKEGCLEITFQIPPQIKEAVFPLTNDQEEALRCLGVQKIICDEQMVFQAKKQKGKDCELAILEKQKGDIHLKKGDFQTAVECYSKAMELDRFNADIATCKAEALFQQELYAEAEETCSLALSLSDNCSKAYFIRACAKNKLGRLEEAIEDFKFALKLDPGNKEAESKLARLEGELRRRSMKHKQVSKANKCDLPPLECTEETCEVPHKPLPELEVVKVLDEWECKMSLRSLLGEKVLVSNNLSEKVPVSVFEEEQSVIGLFFSGIWCPPSKVFTPELIDWYNRFKKGPKGNLLNIVFVSSDNDEESWKEYSSGMPWYGVNFDDEERKRKLEDKYDVKYIPKLVFVEGKTGKIITTEGRSIVSKDPLGEGFPWKQKTFTEIMAKGKLLDQNKKELKWEQLQGKLIGLFFSGYNCDPAIEFTFKLVLLYGNLKNAKKEFEIIYVGFDEDEREWQEYSNSMPWVSFPYEDERAVELRKLFDVEDIPTLILIDGEGGLITTEGCSCVESDPEGTNFPWYRYVDTLTKFTPGNTTDSETYMAQLIWFLPQHLMEKAKEVLEPLAKEYISSKAETKMEIKLLFFIARDGDEASHDARRFARLPQQTPLLTILDMEHNQVHISTSDEVTEENAKKFVYDFLQKRLFGRKLITK